MHRDREEELLDRSFAAGDTRLGGCVRHLLEELEGVPVRAAVLVDRHVGGKASALLRGLVSLPLPLEELEVARRALEGGETARPCAAALNASSAIHRSDRGRRADEPSQKEGSKPTTSLGAVHGRILRSRSRCSSAPSATSPSTSSSGSPVRSPPEGTPTRRSGSARVARRRTSRRGRPSSAPRRDSSGRRARTTPASSSAARLAGYGVEIVGPIEGRNGLDLLPRLAGGRALDGRRPRSGARAAHRRDRSGVARRLRSPPRLGLRADGRAGAERGLARRRARSRRRRSDQRRPGVVERDSRQRRRGVPRGRPRRWSRTSSSRTRTRSAWSAARSSAALWILKRGARGCSFDDDEREALRVERVLDSTGAGDALAAGWIVGGPDLALEAAARCVQHVGAMPVASRRERADPALGRGSRRARRG